MKPAMRNSVSFYCCVTKIYDTPDQDGQIRNYIMFQAIDLLSAQKWKEERVGSWTCCVFREQAEYFRSKVRPGAVLLLSGSVTPKKKEQLSKHASPVLISVSQFFVIEETDNLYRHRPVIDIFAYVNLYKSQEVYQKTGERLSFLGYEKTGQDSYNDWQFGCFGDIAQKAESLRLEKNDFVHVRGTITQYRDKVTDLIKYSLILNDIQLLQSNKKKDRAPGIKQEPITLPKDIFISGIGNGKHFG